MTITYDRNKRETYESDFAVVFGPTNKYWHSNPEYNETFIMIQQSYMNDLLAARGHVFLNELYDALGFPRVPQGQLIGWFYSEGPIINLRLTKNHDGSFKIEPNVINSDVMYFKI